MAQAKPSSMERRESFVGPVRVRLRIGSTQLSRLYEQTQEGRRGVVRLRMPLPKNGESEHKNSEASEPKKVRVRSPRKPRIDLDAETREVVNGLEANLVSVGLRILEVRRYETRNGVTYLVWMFHEPGQVAIEGSGETLSQAIASLLNAARKRKQPSS